MPLFNSPQAHARETLIAATLLVTLSLYLASSWHFSPKRSRPPPLRASTHAQDGKHHLLLAATGSVATIKLPLILQALSKHQDRLSTRVVLTNAATRFLSNQSPEQPDWRTLESIPGVDGVYTDEDEWRGWKRGDSVLHIELRKWADVTVVAPCSADALAKISAGIADSLVTSVLRAWDVKGVDTAGRGVGPAEGLGEGARRWRPVVLAPAMNTAMWVHPVTEKQLRIVEGEWGEWMTVLRPVEKTLVCGDGGTGAMKEWSEIVVDIEGLFDFRKDEWMGSLRKWS